MYRACVLALFAGLLVLSGGSFGQENKTKEVPKKEQVKKDEAKKEDAPTKLKGVLPPNFKKIGLTDSQVQEIYKIQNKYDAEIDKLQAKIDELKANKKKDTTAVLTAEQKKRLEEIQTGKDK